MLELIFISCFSIYFKINRLQYDREIENRDQTINVRGSECRFPIIEIRTKKGLFCKVYRNVGQLISIVRRTDWISFCSLIVIEVTIPAAFARTIPFLFDNRK